VAAAVAKRVQQRERRENDAWRWYAEDKKSQPTAAENSTATGGHRNGSDVAGPSTATEPVAAVHQPEEEEIRDTTLMTVVSTPLRSPEQIREYFFGGPKKTPTKEEEVPEEERLSSPCEVASPAVPLVNCAVGVAPTTVLQQCEDPPVLLETLGVGPVLPADPPPPNSPPPPRGFSTRKPISGVQCTLFLPRKGAPKATILFLHGRGQCGSDNRGNLQAGLPEWLETARGQWPVAVVIPQKPAKDESWCTYERQVLAHLDSCMATANLDRKRVAITGLSQGGHGALHIAANNPHRFRAVAVCCGFPSYPDKGQLKHVTRWQVSPLPPGAPERPIMLYIAL